MYMKKERNDANKTFFLKVQIQIGAGLIWLLFIYQRASDCTATCWAAVYFTMHTCDSVLAQ